MFQGLQVLPINKLLHWLVLLQWSVVNKILTTCMFSYRHKSTSEHQQEFKAVHNGLLFGGGGCCAHGTWKFLGQELNLSHSSNRSRCSDNAGSLICCAIKNSKQPFPFNFSDVPDFLSGLPTFLADSYSSCMSFFSEAFPEPRLGQVCLSAT